MEKNVPGVPWSNLKRETSTSGAIYWPSVCGNDSFWGPDSWNSFRPDWSECFEATVLVWVPCAILWLCAPLYLRYLYRDDNSEAALCATARRGPLNIVKTLLGIVLTALLAAEMIVVGVVGTYQQSLPYLLAAFVKFATMGLATVLIMIEFRRAVSSSAVLFLFFIIYAICSTAALYSYSLRKENHTLDALERTLFGVRVTSYVCVLLEMILSCVPDGVVLGRTVGGRARGDGERASINESVSGSYEEREPLLPGPTATVVGKLSPQRKASFLSRWFFAWVTPMLYRAYMTGYTYETLHDILPTEVSTGLLAQFHRHKARNQDSAKKASRLYLSALLRSVAPVVLGSGFLRFLTIVLLFLNLLVFRSLIAFVKTSGMYTWQGYLYSILLLVITIFRGMIVAQWLYWSDMVGMRLRTLVTTTIYRKVLKLSVACASQNMDIGFIVNLMSVDSLKLSLACRSMHDLILLPIYLALATYFLFMLLRWAALIGMLVMITMVPLVTFTIARKTRSLQNLQMDAKDERLKVMNEILSGIKVLKLYAWELFFERKVTAIRDRELRYMRHASLLNVFSNVVCTMTPFILSLIMFGAFIYLPPGATLDPGTAFVVLSLVCLLNNNISTIPSSVAYLIQGIISIRRASMLMDLEEVAPPTDRLLAMPEGPAVIVDNGTFSWGDAPPTLHSINFSVPHGSLVAVIGPVGSGKSSLLSSILGEMKTLSGSITTQENIGYTPQQAWVQHGTLRDNVCFGRPFKESRYRKVIDACSLTTDLKILAAGDMTELGGKGVNLSGGQKQRVSLARAVYWNADLYLIDDALSAVDPNVGKDIFDHAIGPKGLLRKRTRIFATNTLSILPQVDYILIMKDGRIAERGSYAELRQTSELFRELTSMEGGAPTTPTTPGGPPGGLRQSVSHSVPRILSVDELRRALSHAPPSRAGEAREMRRLSSLDSVTSFSAILESLNQDEQMEDVVPHGGGAPGEGQTGALTTGERTAVGFIGWGVVGDCIRSGTWAMFVLVLFGYALFVAAQAASSIWLCIWTDDTQNATLHWYHSDGAKLGMYGGIVGVQLVAAVIQLASLAVGFLIASRTLHSDAICRLFRAPTSFFDTTPLGRILNYVSTDMDTVDAALPLDVQLWMVALASIVSTVVTLCYARPVFLAVILPVLVVNLIVQRIYGTIAIPLKRLYAQRKSPVYSHFEETICGAPSVRAYRRENDFIARCDQLTDNSHKPWHQYIVFWRWYTTYNEMMGALTIFLTAIVSIVIQQHSTDFSPSELGLALFSAFQVLPNIPIASRMMIEIEANIVAVERIKYYSNILLEDLWERPETRPPPSWPQSGAIEFRGYGTRYRPGLPLVVSDLTCSVKGGEKIGVVGRTGAGKSSIVLSLFRILEAAEGSLLIDGVEISMLGLHDLRSRLTTIPQDPMLFSGSLRSNADPSGSFADSQIIQALENAHLKDFIRERNGLDFQISNIEDLSVGQRQLLCLARALLRNSKIIVLDEATAGVDHQTDELIQQTIRTQFKHSTVITIAHRLATIMDYDRVMVFDQGKLIEFKPPRELLADKKSLFAAMARDVQLSAATAGRSSGALDTMDEAIEHGDNVVLD